MYTSTDDVKNRIGADNVPSSITDAMIQDMVVGSDALIDSRTNKGEGGWSSSYSLSAEDSGVNRNIKESSTLFSAATLGKRLAGGRGSYQLGDFRMSKSELRDIANDCAKRADEILSNIDPNVTIKKSND